MPERAFSQLDLVNGIFNLLAVLGVKNSPPRVMDKCVAAADMIIEELDREPVAATEDMGLKAWLASDDTGLSSLYLAHVLLGVPQREGWVGAYPWDPSDFGRCYRFLQAVPEARAKFASLAFSAARRPVWAAYKKHWADMEKLWLEESPRGKCPKLYALMQTLRDQAEKPSIKTRPSPPACLDRKAEPLSGLVVRKLPRGSARSSSAT